MQRGVQYVWLLFAAVLVSAVCWFVVGRWHPLVPLSKELAMLDQPTQEQMATIRTHNQTNDGYVFLLFGALAAVAGIPVFIHRSGAVGKIASLFAAIVAGGASGWGMAKIGFYCEDWLPLWDPLVRTAVTRMSMFFPLGVVAGLIATASSGSWKHAGSLVAGGVVGSIAAALLLCLLAAVFFQTENFDAVLPPGSNARLLLFGITPFLVWASIARQLSSVLVPDSEPSLKQMETA